MPRAVSIKHWLLPQIFQCYFCHRGGSRSDIALCIAQLLNMAKGCAACHYSTWFPCQGGEEIHGSMPWKEGGRGKGKDREMGLDIKNSSNELKEKKQNKTLAY